MARWGGGGRGRAELLVKPEEGWEPVRFEGARAVPRSGMGGHVESTRRMEARGWGEGPGGAW